MIFTCSSREVFYQIKWGRNFASREKWSTMYCTLYSKIVVKHFLKLVQPTRAYTILVQYCITVQISRPSDRSVHGETPPRAEIRTRARQSRDRDTITTRPPHIQRSVTVKTNTYVCPSKIAGFLLSFMFGNYFVILLLLPSFSYSDPTLRL